MTLGEIVSRFPRATEIMLKSGLHCAGCPGAMMETVEMGAVAHGMTKAQLEKMLKEMNDAEKG
ncbi:disulfide oxidoreductase [Candidatus Micrarchaeota archaeon CG08_land_8_20_14_0_20_59_11]|nr:MAG: disulfide oxidoreductase [Candidatus Micrarchaeota archaeon CG08_land_8_20_14_0_20_59_11]